MHNTLIYPVGSTKACHYAASFLKQADFALVDHPTPEATHLLLDVPSFDTSGHLRGGGDLKEILSMLPANITIIGGNLTAPLLNGYSCLDLLKNEAYLARNAYITAECALQAAYSRMDCIFSGIPVLILGWGRIGKCLGQLLHSLGAQVTIAARKSSDRAMIQALGYNAIDMAQISAQLPQCKVLFNTVPELLLLKDQLSLYKDCVKIDLASKPGMEGQDILWARGLPGVYAPASSGKLIANTILDFFKEGTS